MPPLAGLSRRGLLAALAFAAAPYAEAKNKKRKRRKQRRKRRRPPPSGCPTLRGTIAIQNVTGPACTSPVGVCAELRYRGDLSGTAAFIATSLMTIADTPATGVVLFTADTTLPTAEGTLQLKDAGALGTTGAADFVDLVTVVGGDGRWAGATGQLKIAGRFATATEDGEASYSGTICPS